MHGIRFHLMTHTEKLCSVQETRELTAKEHHLMNIPKSESKKKTKQSKKRQDKICCKCMKEDVCVCDTMHKLCE